MRRKEADLKLLSMPNSENSSWPWWLLPSTLLRSSSFQIAQPENEHKDITPLIQVPTVETNVPTTTITTNATENDTVSQTSSRKRRRSSVTKLFCEVEGCTKYRQGQSARCFAHGGGYQCSFPYCTTGARTKNGFCTLHGGGKRCTVTHCKSAARSGSNYCVRHGGGKRCKFTGCQKCAQGSTNYCRRHFNKIKEQNPT